MHLVGDGLVLAGSWEGGELGSLDYFWGTLDVHKQSVVLKGLQLRGEPCTGWGWGRGALLTSALAAGPHIPAAVFDVDPAVHVALRLVVVVNQAAVQVEDEPVSLPAAQDGA